MSALLSPPRVVPLDPLARAGYYKQTSREWRDVMRAAGLCSRCKGPAEPGLRSCRACLLRGSKMRRAREARKLADLPPGMRACLECLDAIPLADGRSRCEPCRISVNARVSRSAIARRQRALALGLCGDCQGNPVAPNRRACVPCLEKSAARQKARKHNQRP